MIRSKCVIYTLCKSTMGEFLAHREVFLSYKNLSSFWVEIKESAKVYIKKECWWMRGMRWRTTIEILVVSECVTNKGSLVSASAWINESSANFTMFSVSFVDVSYSREKTLGRMFKNFQWTISQRWTMVNRSFTNCSVYFLRIRFTMWTVEISSTTLCWRQNVNRRDHIKCFHCFFISGW